MNLAALEILLADGCDAEALGKWGEARAELDALAAEVLTAHLAQIEPASVEARATAHDVATIEGK